VEWGVDSNLLLESDELQARVAVSLHELADNPREGVRLR
jgi:hypothetical protein